MSKVLIPLLLEKRLVLFDEAADFCKFVASEVNRACESNRAEPELCVTLRLLNVDMRRLVSLTTEKKEPIPFHSEDIGHSSLIAHRSLEEKTTLLGFYWRPLSAFDKPRVQRAGPALGVLPRLTTDN
jgi:hypothetical protein